MKQIEIPGKYNSKSYIVNVADADDNRTFNITVIDDDDYMRWALNKQIEKKWVNKSGIAKDTLDGDIWTYNPVIAKDTLDGEILFEEAKKLDVRLDILIQDIKMPGGMPNGLDFVDKIREVYEINMIIFISGAGMEPETKRRIEEGGYMFFEKDSPTFYKDLKRVIDQYISK